MERVKVEPTKYVAVAVHENGMKENIQCMIPDIERAAKSKGNGNILGCVIYPAVGFGNQRCALYYNEGGYPEEELRAAGYDIVEELREVEVYEESKKIL